MFTNIKITDFKSCQETTLDGLGPVTVLVGRNGAGKSNILQAIEWLASVGSYQPQFIAPHRNSHNVAAEFEVDGVEYRYSASVIWSRDKSAATPEPGISIRERLDFLDSRWQQILSRTDEIITVEGRSEPIKINQTATCLPSLFALLPKDDPLLSRIRPVVSFLSSVRYYTLDEPTVSRSEAEERIISQASYVWWQSNLDDSGRPMDDVQRTLLNLHLEAPEKFDELKSLLGCNGLGLFDEILVESVVVGTGPFQKSDELPNTIHFLEFVPCAAKTAASFAYYELSHGTRRILRMVVSLFFDNALVMLIEHPEDGIHSGLLKKLMHLLHEYSVPAQEIITSHSTELFNVLDPADVRLVSMTDGTTIVRPLSSIELVAATQYVSSDGPLSDFLETVQDDYSSRGIE